MPNRKSSLLEAGEIDFRLTPFDRRMIALTVAGYSRQETAKRLGVSAPALALHLSRIYGKLRVANPLELILFALYHRLIDPAADTLQTTSSRSLVVR
jgi:DNA-binding CsgD family transcriptional regulator